MEIRISDTFCILGLLSAALYGLRQWALPKPIPNIPYRPEATKSILGDGPAMLAATNERHITWIQWISQEMQRMQTPIMQIFLPFKPPIVVLAHYSESQNICTRRVPKQFDRSRLLSDLLMGLLPGSHILFRTNDMFKAHRRMLQPLRTTAFLQTVAAPAIHAQALKLIKLWKLKGDIANGRAFRADEDVFDAALDAAFAFTFGQHFSHSATDPKFHVLHTMQAVDAADEEEVQSLHHPSETDAVNFPTAPADDNIAATLTLTRAVEEVQGTLSMRLKWRILSLSPRIRWARKIRQRFINDMLRQAVQRHTEGSKASYPATAIDYMVHQEQQTADRDQRAPNFFSPTMRDDVFAFIVGGHDTTSTTIAWGLKLLTDNQRVQTKLRNALQVGLSEAAREQSVPTPAEIQSAKLPYLAAVIEEILRCGGTTPALDREAIVDTEILGHHIPKGTTVLMLTQSSGIKSPAISYGSNQSKSGPKLWDDNDIAEFKPERWLRASENDSDFDTFDPNAGPILAFGAGIRSCWGRNLGYLELRIYITLVVWHFYLQPCGSGLSSYDAIAGVTSKPRQCYIKLRSVELESMQTSHYRHWYLFENGQSDDMVDANVRTAVA